MSLLACGDIELAHLVQRMDVQREDLKPGTQYPGRESRAASFGLISSSSPKSVPYLSILSLQETESVIAAISTRIGGVSRNPYHSLNLGYHVGDVSEDVAENRNRFCSTLGIDVDSLVIAEQVHGDGIAVVDDSQAGCGARRHEDAINDADGMITTSRSVALAVLTADCVPILVVDSVREAIGIAHAGWRGALRMIAAGTVLKMKSTFGTEPADCLVALGPAICPCCYRVGEEVFAQFQEIFGLAACVLEDRLDLRRAVEIQLVDVGVKKRNISSLGTGRASPALCTACNRELFYSHRAEGGRTGRMMSVIKLI